MNPQQKKKTGYCHGAVLCMIRKTPFHTSDNEESIDIAFN